MAETDGLSVLGWVSIFAGGVVVRFATRGRGLNAIPGDLSDLTIAAVSGGDVAAVLARTGTTDATSAGASSATTGASSATTGASGLLAEMQTLGGKATGYRLGSTGPDYYDCSGLVWASMKALGYTGSRFTTASFANGAPPGFTKITAPQAGDIVVWSRGGVNGHMGVMTDGANFYSALSPRSGIKTLPVANITKQKGYAPDYYRWIG